MAAKGKAEVELSAALAKAKMNVGLVVSSDIGYAARMSHEAYVAAAKELNWAVTFDRETCALLETITSDLDFNQYILWD